MCLRDEVAIVTGAIRALAVRRPSSLQGRGRRSPLRSATRNRGRIRVDNICPGVIETPMLVGDMTDGKELERIRRRSEAKQVTVGWARAEEGAEAALFLAWCVSCYVDGTSIFVDDGLLARRGTR